MACGGCQTLNWSDRTYRIRDIIRDSDFTLPLLVKVEEGIYGCHESDTFSQDDLLKLDLVKSIPKVVTCCVDHLGRDRYSGVLREDEHGYVEKTEDLTIPLRYRGVVNIFHPESGRKVYHSVRELVRDFPRYVKTVDPFVSKNNVRVDRKSVIELDRIIPGEGLVCNIVTDESSVDEYSNTTQILLDISVQQKFFLMPDNNDYTLQQVISRFPLPQYVTFVKESGPKLVTTNIQEAVEQTNVFEGTVKIKSTVELKIIIGHYKPPEGAKTVTQSRCQRTLVIIPIDSYTAREIEVRVPLDPGVDDDYEMVLAKNFTQKDIEEENIDGTIYVDFLRTPKTTFVEYEEIDIPPPRPPRNPGNTMKYVRESTTLLDDLDLQNVSPS
ncbi:uncharacterized protein LOC110442011 [Mizuhopecten yessoensis]|uniref:uncharacterized protein LOC110442011 n=1 Tax=Mizuhopecten yessoensis TaxID=6573 RepID=UPI000B45C64A|nr:uncharacterized protein LOC110442011 [Mizuhopecten yessoensis]